MRDNVLQDDQHYDDDNGVSRWQMIRVTERWETLGPEGQVVVSEASRDAAIESHHRSNDAFDYHAKFMADKGETVENYSTPLCGVRRVVRYETGSRWEVVAATETVEEEAHA